MCLLFFAQVSFPKQTSSSQFSFTWKKRVSFLSICLLPKEGNRSSEII